MFNCRGGSGNAGEKAVRIVAIIEKGLHIGDLPLIRLPGKALPLFVGGHKEQLVVVVIKRGHSKADLVLVQRKIIEIKWLHDESPEPFVERHQSVGVDSQGPMQRFRGPRASRISKSGCQTVVLSCSTAVSP